MIRKFAICGGVLAVILVGCLAVTAVREYSYGYGC